MKYIHLKNIRKIIYRVMWKYLIFFFFSKIAGPITQSFVYKHFELRQYSNEHEETITKANNTQKNLQKQQIKVTENTEEEEN